MHDVISHPAHFDEFRLKHPFGVLVLRIERVEGSLENLSVAFVFNDFSKTAKINVVVQGNLMIILVCSLKALLLEIIRKRLPPILTAYGLEASCSKAV